MSASHKPKPIPPHAYLVRFWRDGPGEPWRALAKQVSDGREHYFASPEKLFLFLHEQTTNDDGPTTNDQP